MTEVPATGCQPTCLSLATDQLKLPGSCKDQPSNRAWNETWDTYIPAMKFVIGFLVRIYLSCLVENLFKTEGGG